MSGHVEGCCREKSRSTVTAPDRVPPFTNLRERVGLGAEPCYAAKTDPFDTPTLVKRSTMLSEVAVLAKESRDS